MSGTLDLLTSEYNAVPGLKKFRFVTDLKDEEQVKQWYH